MATKSSRSSASQSDNTVAYILLAVLSACVLAFAAWMYFQFKARTDAAVAYTSFGPMVVRSNDFSLRTTVSIQSRHANATAVQAQEKQIGYALQAGLSNLDSTRARQPDGITYVQQVARDAVRGVVGQQMAEEVLVTDFIIQEN